MGDDIMMLKDTNLKTFVIGMRWGPTEGTHTTFEISGTRIELSEKDYTLRVWLFDSLICAVNSWSFFREVL